MKIDWCWACRREHPMLDDAEFDAVWQAWQSALKAESAQRRAREGDSGAGTPRERLLKLQNQPRSELPPVVDPSRLHFRPLQEAYERLTGLRFDGDNPKVIMHYRVSFYGPPCPYCRRLLRNTKARQCFECGMDWHDPQIVICHKKGKPAEQDGSGGRPKR